MQGRRDLSANAEQQRADCFSHSAVPHSRARPVSWVIMKATLDLSVEYVRYVIQKLASSTESEKSSRALKRCSGPEMAGTKGLVGGGTAGVCLTCMSLQMLIVRCRRHLKSHLHCGEAFLPMAQSSSLCCQFLLYVLHVSWVHFWPDCTVRFYKMAGKNPIAQHKNS